MKKENLPADIRGIGRPMEGGRERPAALLAIDLQIRIRTKLYRLQIRDALKWLIPVVVILTRVIAELRRATS